MIAMQPRLSQITGTPRKLEWDDFVYHQGDEVHTVYLVQNGTVELGRLTVTGNEISVAQLGEGEWFGEAEVLLGLERREYFARAVGRALVLPVPLRDLSPVSIAELRQLSIDRLYRIQLCLADLVPEPPAGRVTSLLRHLSSQSDTIRMSMRALSKATHCPRETVNRTLHQLEESGVIRLDRCVITVLVPERLGI